MKFRDQACLKSGNLTMLALWFFVLSIRASCANAEEHPSPKSAPEEAAILQTVADGIRDNYRKIPHLSCKIKSTHVKPAVKEKTTVRGHTIGKDGKPNGGMIVYVEEPLTAYISKVLISGESLRVDSRRISTGEESFESFHNGVRCSVIPEHKWASFHFYKDMGGLWNRDPRHVGSTDQKVDFVAKLLDSQLASHETIKTPTGERLVLHLQRDYPEYKITAKWRCEVDPRRSYLPCRIVTYAPSGSGKEVKINFVHDVEYQAIPERKAWFLKKSTLKFYHPNYADSPDQESWGHQSTEEVQGSIEVFANVDPSRFAIEIPPGIEVRDQTGGRRQKGEQEK